jgi:hypothetical protein
LPALDNVCLQDLRYFYEKKLCTRGNAMDNGRERAWSPWYWLLVLQFVPCLWVPLYNTAEPRLAGIPFFYWFQLALVFASAAVTAVVYFATEPNR